MNKKRVKILVLGTGNAQSDLIKLCKKKNFEVHSCSYKKEGRGIEESDRFTLINITDTTKIIDYVKNEEIDIVYSVGSDLAMYTVAEVSEQLNLPTFIESKTALICKEKSELRNKLDEIPEFSVISKNLNNAQELRRWAIYPAIVKPDDSQGQRGISEIKKSSQIQTAFKKAVMYSKNNSAIIEEFIEGFEISINLYVVNGIVEFQFITQRIKFPEYPGGIVKSHKYPVSEKIDMIKINRMIHSAIKLLNIQNGPVYMQVIVNQKGNPKIIEITPRMDGCHLWHLIDKIYGINILGILISHLVYGVVNSGLFKINSSIKKESGELIFFTSKPNILFKKNRFYPKQKAAFIEWYYVDGEKVSEINGYKEKVGYQILFN